MMTSSSICSANELKMNTDMMDTIAFQHLLSANEHQQKQDGQRGKEKPLLLLKPDGHAIGDAHVSARRQQD